MGRCAGAFSEYAVMDVREAIAMPATFWEEAASIPLTFLVVLRHARAAGTALKAGEWLLVDRHLLGRRRAALRSARSSARK
jgi:NADPH:quinone reductase-like Zn-dependent oxidoreductase